MTLLNISFIHSSNTTQLTFNLAAILLDTRLIRLMVSTYNFCAGNNNVASPE